MDEQVTKELSSLEARVERLAVQVEELSARVDGLAGKAGPSRASPEARPAAEDEFPDAAEAILSWVRRSSLLQRLSTLCFLLVIALVLRTITDNGMIDRRIGSVIGVSYAAVLMGMGWLRYRRGSPLAPVFTVCGTVLMFTIIGEAHARLGALPSVPAYILLMLTALGTAGISYVHRVPVPILVGNLGMCITGAAIDYPTPFFPYLGILLLTANLLGYATARAHRYSWPRWILLLITLFMIHLWGFKLGMTLLGHEQPPPALAPGLFLPFLALFTATYMATALLGIIRVPPGEISRFELFLPAINVAWAFPLARYVLSAMNGGVTTLGIVGAVVGAGHLVVAYRLAGRDPQGAAGANAFFFAGAVLLALALPTAAHSPFLSLPLLAAVALGAAVLAVAWRSGSVRLTSYLLQLYVAVALSASLLEKGAAQPVWVRALSAGVVACLGFVQYWWCRRRPPPGESAFFRRIDTRDFSAVFILLASLLCAFIALRVVLHHILSLTLAPSEMDNVFYGSQSVVINLAAILLMFIAWAYRNTELRNTAILVTVIGAVNVFLYDLIRTQGVPLVISMLSVGLATAVESILLGRWQQRTKPAGEDGG